MQSGRQERGLQAAETFTRSERPNNPDSAQRPPLGESEESVQKFACPLPDARFCGLKAALRPQRWAGASPRCGGKELFSKGGCGPSVARMLIGRKLLTLATTVRRCRNWPALVWARLRRRGGPWRVVLRDGLVLELPGPVNEYWGNFFEPAVADVYGVRQARPDVIVDVGGNIGAFSCHAAWRHPQAQVHAFEPQEVEGAAFQASVENNGLRNVMLHRQLVTRDGRQVAFAVNVANRAASGIFSESGSGQARPSVTLDVVPLAGAKSLFVKLDCEGAEGELIAWLCEQRERLPARVQVACEYHPWCPVPLAESSARLGRAGFAVTVVSKFGETYLFATSGRAD